MRWLEDDVLELSTSSTAFPVGYRELYRWSPDALLLERLENCVHSPPLPWMVAGGGEATVSSTCVDDVARRSTSWVSRAATRADGRIEVEHAQQEAIQYRSGRRRESESRSRYLLDPSHGWVVAFEQSGNGTDYLEDGSVDSENDYSNTWELVALDV